MGTDQSRLSLVLIHQIGKLTKQMTLDRHLLAAQDIQGFVARAIKACSLASPRISMQPHKCPRKN